MKVKTRLIVSISLATTIIGGLFSVILYTLQSRDEDKRFEVKKAYYTEMVKSLVVEPLWNMDIPA